MTKFLGNIASELYFYAGNNLPLIFFGSYPRKQDVARQIHEHSARKDRAFIVADMAVVLPEEMEEVLFGKAGLLVKAKGGTLFIDNLEVVPLDLQKRLQKAINWTDYSGTLSDDPRVISSINLDSQEAMAMPTLKYDFIINFHKVAAEKIDVVALTRELTLPPSTRQEKRRGRPVRGIDDPSSVFYRIRVGDEGGIEEIIKAGQQSSAIGRDSEVQKQRDVIKGFFVENGASLSALEIARRLHIKTNIIIALMGKSKVNPELAGSLKDDVKRYLSDFLAEIGRQEDVAKFQAEFEKMRDLVGYNRKAIAL